MNEINQNNCVGKRIGLYDILYECDYKSKDGHRIFHIRCSKCGWETDNQFRKIKYLSNRCSHKNINGKYHQYKNAIWRNQRIQSVFHGMMTRCYNVNDRSYHWYGAKGIKICDEWLNNPKSFEDWALSNDYQDGLTIDRIDSNENYCPDNCRWATLKDNTKYKSTTSYINVDGEVHTGRDWAEILGLGTNRINTYMRTYGLDNTVEFIRRYRNNPNLQKHPNQNIYALYMCD